jgi:hypothetical protein
MEYRLTVTRTVTMINTISIEGDSPDDAMARFQHQLESRECSAIEDEESWGESYYYQVVKAGPYCGEYSVLSAEPCED